MNASYAILFDIDGTLIDSTYHHALAWQRAFHDLGLPIALYRIHRAIGMGGDKLVAHVAGDDVEKRLGDQLRSRWRERYQEVKGEVQPLPGATEIVRRAVAEGHQVALASSGDPEFAAEAVDLLAIRDEVAVLTTSEDVQGSKPEPDLIGETLARLDGVTHAVLVGDTPYDVESAKRAGIGCLAVRSGGYSDAELVEAGAELVAGDLADLYQVDWRAYCVELART